MPIKPPKSGSKRGKKSKPASGGANLVTQTPKSSKELRFDDTQTPSPPRPLLTPSQPSFTPTADGREVSGDLPTDNYNEAPSRRFAHEHEDEPYASNWGQEPLNRAEQEDITQGIEEDDDINRPPREDPSHWARQQEAMKKAQSLFPERNEAKASPFATFRQWGGESRSAKKPRRFPEGGGPSISFSATPLEATRSPSPSASMAMISVEDTRDIFDLKLDEVPPAYLPEPPRPLLAKVRTAAQHRLSRTTEIMNRVLARQIADGGAGLVRRDPADYMARTCSVSFGFGGLVVRPVQTFSARSGHVMHAVELTTIKRIPNTVPYVSVLREHHHASMKQRNTQGEAPRGPDGGPLNSQTPLVLPEFPIPTGRHLFSLLHRYRHCYEDQSADADVRFARKNWHGKTVWGLFNALWGRERDPRNLEDPSLEQFHDNWPDGSSSEHEAQESQEEEAVRRWLCRAIEECPDIGGSGKGGIKSLAVLEALTRMEIPKATKLAIKLGDLRLATLLSQSMGGQDFKKYIFEQIQNWERWGVVKEHPGGQQAGLFDPARQRIYLLLAGKLHDPRLKLTNFHWLQGLAMHLYFNVNQQGTNGVLRRGLESFHNSSTVSSPVSWDTAGSGQERPPDTMYQLLRLRYDLEKDLACVLAERCNTGNHFEHHMSWHLAMAIEGLAEWRNSLSCVARSRLISNYVEELEMIGLWHWGVYVALHLPDRVRAKALVQRLLNLHCPGNEREEEECLKRLKERKAALSRAMSLARNQEERNAVEKEKESIDVSINSSWVRRKEFLTSKDEGLGIPITMVHKALALRAGYEGRTRDEMRQHRDAKDWDPLHRCIIDNLMPECMITRDATQCQSMDDLVQFVTTMAEISSQFSIKGWSQGGSILNFYFNVEARFERIEATDLDSLFRDIEMLCQRLEELGQNIESNSLIKYPVLLESTINDRVICLHEMASKVKNWCLAIRDNRPQQHHPRALHRLFGLPMTVEDRLDTVRRTAKDHLKLVAHLC